MLLAEIHGKHCASVENHEDYLTSAVFGHLRFVEEGNFWTELMRRCVTVQGFRTNLLNELVGSGFVPGQKCLPRLTLWRCFGSDEPDVLLQLSWESEHPVLLLVEVKLKSGKSSTGEQDQLRRYYELLHHPDRLGELASGQPYRALVYLTEAYAGEELRESIRACGTAEAERGMYLLQWQDMVQVIRTIEPRKDSLLDELLRFLVSRGFERFCGFKEAETVAPSITGRFYASTYFRHAVMFDSELTGAFYDSGRAGKTT